MCIRDILGEMHILYVKHNKQRGIYDNDHICQDPVVWWANNQWGLHIEKRRIAHQEVAAKLAGGMNITSLIRNTYIS